MLKLPPGAPMGGVMATGVQRRVRPQATGWFSVGRRDQGPLILIAEDGEISREVIEALLAKRGLRTDIAPNGLQAWRMAVNKAYAAILMDCRMPELDGWEATRRIRATEGDFHVPIIAMTAYGGDDSRAHCLRVGMDDYLAKPVRGAQLDTTIKRWLTAIGPD
jgi:CheY-like chemotaxis protein